MAPNPWHGIYHPIQSIHTITHRNLSDFNPDSERMECENIVYLLTFRLAVSAGTREGGGGRIWWLWVSWSFSYWSTGGAIWGSVLTSLAAAAAVTAVIMSDDCCEAADSSKWMLFTGGWGFERTGGWWCTAKGGFSIQRSESSTWVKHYGLTTLAEFI